MSMVTLLLIVSYSGDKYDEVVIIGGVIPKCLVWRSNNNNDNHERPCDHDG